MDYTGVDDRMNVLYYTIALQQAACNMFVS